jgi:hypothetical protein
MTALLVVGSAPCLFEDVAAARKLFPDAHLMLVNGAGVAIEDAEHVLAGHTSKAEQFARARREAFPFAMPWRLHASAHARQFRRATPKEAVYPSVTDWWGPEYRSGATSVGKAVLIGLAMFYGPVVICGAPMDGSGYFPGESQTGARIDHEKACQRIGDKTMQQRRTIMRYRETFKQLAETQWKGKVFSMSGFTKQCLGAP